MEKQDLSGTVGAAMQQRAVPLDEAKVRAVLDGVPAALASAKHTSDGWYRAILWDVTDQFRDVSGLDVWMKLKDIGDARFHWISSDIREVLRVLESLDLGSDVEFGVSLWKEQDTGLTGRWLVVLQFRCKHQKSQAKPDAAGIKAAMLQRGGDAS